MLFPIFQFMCPVVGYKQPVVLADFDGGHYGWLEMLACEFLMEGFYVLWRANKIILCILNFGSQWVISK